MALPQSESWEAKDDEISGTALRKVGETNDCGQLDVAVLAMVSAPVTNVCQWISGRSRVGMEGVARMKGAEE
eukprot:scaffold1609_cov252-Pinguiococcus_pyrenoidosus.AAC.7